MLHYCKDSLSYELYLDVLPNSLRFFVTRIRLSALSLRVQTGRFGSNRNPRNELYCQCCNSLDIEDEYHFTLICPCFSNIRKKYIKKHYYVRPSMFKFIELLKTENKSVLIKLAKYIKESLEIRNKITNVNEN